MSSVQQSRSSRTSSTRFESSAYQINLRADIRPGGGNTERIPGSITISSNTISIFKGHEDIDAEPLFLGVALIPNISFTRSRPDAANYEVTVQRADSQSPLFASVGVDKSQPQTPVNREDSASAPADSTSSRSKKESAAPSSWNSFTLIFDTHKEQERVVDALLARKAMEIYSQPSSLHTSRTPSTYAGLYSAASEVSASVQGVKPPQNASQNGNGHQSSATGSEQPAPVSRASQSHRSNGTTPASEASQTSSKLRPRSTSPRESQSNRSSKRPAESEKSSQHPTESIRSSQRPAESVKSGQYPTESIRSSQKPAESEKSSQHATESIRSSQRPVDSVRSSNQETESIRSSRLETESIRSSQHPAESIRSSQHPAESTRSSQKPAESIRSSQRPAESVKSSQHPAESIRSSQHPTESIRSSQRPRSAGAGSRTPRSVQQPQESASERSPRSSRHETESVRSSQQGTESVYSSQYPSESARSSQHPAESIRSSQHPAESTRSSQKPAESIRSSQRPAESVKSSQHPAESIRSSQHPTESIRSSQRPRSAGASSRTPRSVQQPQDSASERSPRSSRQGTESVRSSEIYHDEENGSTYNSHHTNSQHDTASHKSGSYTSESAAGSIYSAQGSQSQSRQSQRSSQRGESQNGNTRNGQAAPPSMSASYQSYGVPPSNAFFTPNEIITEQGGSVRSSYHPSNRNAPESLLNVETASGVSGASRDVARYAALPSVGPSASQIGHHLDSVRESDRSFSVKRARSETGQFLRDVLKLMHHRVHVMQYLHKEMVHQAFQAEEAKLKESMAPARGLPQSMTRRTSSYSPRRSLSVSREESMRLKEIQSRLDEVEEIHREAEEERQEAARLRHEYESKSNELERIRRELDEKNEMASRSRADVYEAQIPSDRDRYSQASSHHSRGDQLGYNHSENLVSGSSAVRTNRNVSYANGDNGVVSVPQAQPQYTSYYNTAPVTDEAALSTVVLDRYVYGDEWHLLYPSREGDIRMNAQVDICLACRLPRRHAYIVSLALDNRGLRVTAEIRHDPSAMPREQIERRVGGCAFRFLNRFYELRYCFQAPSGPAAIGDGGSQAGSIAPSSVNQVAPSPMLTTGTLVVHNSNNKHTSASRGSRGSRHSQSRALVPHRMHPAASDSGSQSSDYGKDRASKMLALRRRTEDLLRQKEDELAKNDPSKQPAYVLAVQRHVQLLLAQIEQAESYGRSTIQCAEAREHQRISFKYETNQRRTCASLLRALEEDEQLQRAMLEVGCARQAQVISSAFRRAGTGFRVMAEEATRRSALEKAEAVERDALKEHSAMQNFYPVAMQVIMEEQGRRQRLAGMEQEQYIALSSALSARKGESARAALNNVQFEESRNRAAVQLEEIKAQLELMQQWGELSRNASATRAARDIYSKRIAQTLNELQEEERAARNQIIADEQRRRNASAVEALLDKESIKRDEIELSELDENSDMLDNMVRENRKLVMRHMNEREMIAQLANDEQYARNIILNEEADAWEVLMEIHASEMEDFYIRAMPIPSLAMEDPDLDTPRRRRPTSSPRTAKPFHYMTFATEDMDFPPSAALAIEGILGCSINKNLEITSIQKPLPRTTSEDLQFQAGDMILDVAGHSLHSLSHLREVLSTRTMQIQREAREEFPDVPEEHLTTNPGLQRYIDQLCEHHNFLVQVLRECDSFYIIVRS